MQWIDIASNSKSKITGYIKCYEFVQSYILKNLFP